MIKPSVGIFFFVAGEVIHDSVSLEDGERYGVCVEHGEHYSFWERFLPRSPTGTAFKGHSYDYFPRGRSVYDLTRQRFKLYADRCISQRERLLITSALGLPDDTPFLADEHYQCYQCNSSFVDDNIEETQS